MDPLLHLLIACAAFLLIHVLPSTPARGMLVSSLGEGPYIGLFSLATLATIVWMSMAYKATTAVALWPGLTLIPPVVMPFAFILIVAGVLTPNPTAVAQGRMLKRDEPATGVIRITRHPVMWGIVLWSASHLLARGELHALLFFGSFVVLGAIGTVLQDKRKAQAHGADWQRFAALTSNLPFAAIAQGRNRLVVRELGAVALVFGLLLYGGMLHFHQALFGLRPY